MRSRPFTSPVKSTVKSTVTLGAALGPNVLDNEHPSPDFCRMTPTHVPEQFARTMGCTPAELISWLPRSLPDAQLAVEAARHARQKFFDLHTHRGGG
jgi:hypothetical protein